MTSELGQLLTLSAYYAVLFLLALYGAHRAYMVHLYFRHRRETPRPSGTLAALPRVTVQLPIYNEVYVVERLVSSVAALDYPAGASADPDPRRLDRRDARDRARDGGAAAGARLRRRLPSAEPPAGLQGRRAPGRSRHGHRRVRSHPRRRLRPEARSPPRDPPLLRRSRRGNGPGALGAPQPRLLAPDADPGDPARRPLRHRAHGPPPLRPLLQLQRHRGRLAPGVHREGRRLGGATR